MCEHSSVSDQTALRRELRRRKILENSTNRLKLIEGINSSFGKTSSETLSKSKFVAEPLLRENENGGSESKDNYLNESLNINGALNSNEDLKRISELLVKSDKCEADEYGDENSETFLQIEQIDGNSYFDIIQKKKLHYILLALVVNALLYFNLGYLFYENIFCPFYTIKAIELISKKNEDKEDLQPFLYIFLTTLPKSIQKSAKIICTVLPTLLADLFLYIFAFILGAKILSVQD